MTARLALLDLFSGIGGFSLGLERSGACRTVAFCEIDHAARRTLSRHWPTVPVYDDVKTLTASRLAADGIAVDAICGGFPCQDISRAWGGGRGLDGERSGLWLEFRRLVCELRPAFVIVENVAALLQRGFGRVVGDLAALGYDSEWRCVPASGVGAPHERDRVWIVAYTGGARLARPVFDGAAFPVPGPAKVAKLGNRALRVGREWAEYSPGLCVGDGVPADLVRSALRGFGNAVVPAIPEHIGRAIMAAQTGF